MENLLIGSAFPTAAERINVDQAALQAAAYGDVQQQNRIALRLSQMNMDNLMKQKGFSEGVDNLLRLGGGAPQQPQAPIPNNLVGGVGGGMQMPTADPSLSQPPPQQPQDPNTLLAQGLAPGSELYQRYPQMAVAQLDDMKTKKTAEMLASVKLMVEQGKASAEDQKLAQERMEPLMRASVPVQEEYERRRKAGETPAAAAAAVQPLYEQSMSDLSKIPGYADSVKLMPSKFNPMLAYSAKDTFAALERRAQATDMQTAHKSERDEREKEQSPTVYTTPGGKPVFANKKGELYVDGQPYKGKVVKEKTGGGVPGSGGGIEPAGKLGPPDETGKNPLALDGLSPADQQIVKQIAEYKKQLPTGMALRTPYWQKILGRVALYKPEFDETQYNVRLKLRNDFVSGKAAVNARSLNTAVGHLADLDEASKALHKGDILDVPAGNYVSNKLRTARGKPEVKRFETAATAVESELAAVFKGMGATDQEIKAWRANFGVNGSREQHSGAIKTAVQLLFSRLNALNSQYETGMGEPKDFKILSDKARGMLKKLGVPEAEINAADPARATKSTPQSDKPANAPPDLKTMLKQYMTAHPKATKAEIEASDAFKADLQRFGF